MLMSSGQSPDGPLGDPSVRWKERKNEEERMEAGRSKAGRGEQRRGEEKRIFKFKEDKSRCTQFTRLRTGNHVLF